MNMFSVNGLGSNFFGSIYQPTNSSSMSTSTLVSNTTDNSLFGEAMAQTMQQLGISHQHQHNFHHHSGAHNFMQSLFSTLGQISTSNTSTSSNPLLGALNILTQDVQSGSGLSENTLYSLNTSFSNFINQVSQSQPSNSSNSTISNITLQAFLQTLSSNLTNDLFSNSNSLLNITT